MGPPSVEILWTPPVSMKPRSVSRHAPMPLAGINFFHPFAHRFAGRGAVQAQVLTRRFEAEWGASAALIHPLAHVAASALFAFNAEWGPPGNREASPQSS